MACDKQSERHGLAPESNETDHFLKALVRPLRLVLVIYERCPVIRLYKK